MNNKKEWLAFSAEKLCLAENICLQNERVTTERKKDKDSQSR